MKTLIILGLALASCAAVQPTTQTRCSDADVFVTRGVNTTVHRHVDIIEEQDEFCIFVEQGVARMERAPFKIICNQ